MKAVSMTWEEVRRMAEKKIKHVGRPYGVPRGGSVLVAMLCLNPANTPEEADSIVDDVIASGKTKAFWKKSFPTKPFCALIDKTQPDEEWAKNVWIHFPWEPPPDKDMGESITRLIEYVGEDPNREGLKETPARVIKAWKEWTSGYGVNPVEILKNFEDGGEKYSEMVVVRDLPFYSHCEHHLTPFFGTATIGYIPNGKIVGLSKLGRILGVYAKRLQVQERLTTLVADTIQTHLQPKGVGVLIKARHLCMESRGLAKQGHETITSALRGEFMTDGTVRQEFLSIAK